MLSARSKPRAPPLAVADALGASRVLSRSLRDGPAAARASGLPSLVAAAPASTLASAAAVLDLRATAAGKSGTAKRQYLRFCASKGVSPWPVTLRSASAFLVWRLATVSHKTGELYKASGNAAAFAALKRGAVARRRWALSPLDEAVVSRQIARVSACVPATLDSTRAVSLADLHRLLALLESCPPTANRAMARALLAACVGFQARWSELHRAREDDLTLQPAGAVLSVVFGKTSSPALLRRHLIMAPHLGGSVERLCFSSAYLDLLSFAPVHRPGWPLFGTVVDGRLTSTPLGSAGLRRCLGPLFLSLGLSFDSHFGRPTGGSLLEFEVGLTEDLVELMAGRNVESTVYRAHYRNIRDDPALFARYCATRIATSSGPAVPSSPPSCCTDQYLG